MKFDIASDLHVDAWIQTSGFETDASGKKCAVDWGKLKNKDSVGLIVAGDFSDDPRIIVPMVEDALPHYEYIIITLGNHEYHSNQESIFDLQRKLKEFLEPLYPDVYVLNDETPIKIKNTLFMGGIGWYDWKCYEEEAITEVMAYDAWCKGSPDLYGVTWAVNNEGPQYFAKFSSTNCFKVVAESQSDDSIENIIMVTHTSPRKELMRWKNEDHHWNLLTPSYVNTGMKHAISIDSNQKIKYWVYGHTHERKVSKIGHITYINNARGYPNENNKSFVLSQIEVSDGKGSGKSLEDVPT